MFPTSVGMNRPIIHCDSSSISVPHKRGDEPANNRSDASLPCVFPTSVGMNRLAR